MTWDYDNPFIDRIKVTTEAIDELQHTNNAEYVKWCERIAWAHSNSLGISIEDYQQRNRAMAITKAEYQYLQATNLNDELIIATWLVACDKRLSCERQFQIIRKADNVTVTRGKWQLCCIEINSGKPKRMPVHFAEIYGNAVESN